MFFHTKFIEHGSNQIMLEKARNFKILTRIRNFRLSIKFTLVEEDKNPILKREHRIDGENS